MGAVLWQHIAAWEPDAPSALRKLQTELFAARYVYSEYLQDQRAQTAEALRIQQENGDRYGLVDVWSRSLKKIEALQRHPTPPAAYDQFLAIRTIIPEEFGGVLDVIELGESPSPHVMRLLPASELESLFGTTTPAMQDAQARSNFFAESLDRGQSVAFPVFDDHKRPTAWYFIGLTVD